jgi:hypothetical protein
MVGSSWLLQSPDAEEERSWVNGNARHRTVRERGVFRK